MADFDTTFGTIAGDIKAGPDYIFNDAAWPNNTTKDSSVFSFGGTQAALELKVVNSGSAATGALTITLYEADNAADAAACSTNATSTALLSAGTGASFALDEVLCTHIGHGNGMYASLRLTTAADKSAEKITAYLSPLDR